MKERPEGRRGRDAFAAQKKVTHNEMGDEVLEVDVQEEASRDAPIKGLGFAAHRTAKLEEIKAKTLGTAGKLEGSLKAEVKEEMKQEVKQEQEIKTEPLGDGAERLALKMEMKVEVKP